MELLTLEWSHSVKLTLGLLSVVNPVSAVPIFLTLTDEAPTRRKQMGTLAAISVGFILLLSCWLGALLLQGMGISLPSFRVAGGILILLLGLQILSGHSPSISEEERDTAAVVPLSMPLMAGPGAISTAILFAEESQNGSEQIALIFAIAAVSLSVWFCLRLAPWLAQALGATGMRVLNRIMGLLLAALGIEFISLGIAAAFPILNR